MLNKKADPTDIVLFLIIIFFVIISMVVALFVNTKIKTIIDTTELNSSAAYSSISESFKTINEVTVQRGFTLFFGVLIIGMLASSFLIRVHPVFIFIYIITLSAAIFVGIYLANAYELFVSNGQIASIASNYAMMTYIMQHIVLILLATGALSMIIIFGKLFGGGGVTSTSDFG